MIKNDVISYLGLYALVLCDGSEPGYSTVQVLTHPDGETDEWKMVLNEIECRLIDTNDYNEYNTMLAHNVWPIVTFSSRINEVDAPLYENYIAVLVSINRDYNINQLEITFDISPFNQYNTPHELAQSVERTESPIVHNGLYSIWIDPNTKLNELFHISHGALN